MPSVTPPSDTRIRAYNKLTDRDPVDTLEKLCDAGPSGSGGVTLFTDLLGDPLCRVRNFSNYAMLVAEVYETNEIVGFVRVGMKQVTRNSVEGDGIVGTAVVAYILGLRVSPLHRRKSIALCLVQRAEEWAKEMGAEYAYMATEKDNEASLNLFTGKLGYSKLRTPAILVQPVYVKSKRVSSRICIVKLEVNEAELLYRSIFGSREFFPQDIDKIFRSKPHKGTYVAYSASELEGVGTSKLTADFILSKLKSWAVLSLWGCNELYKVEVRGVSARIRSCIATWRLLARLVPGMTVPSYPNMFRPFGFQLMYGLQAVGDGKGELMRNLCWHAHNVARKAGCQVIATEVGAQDPVRALVPYWPRLSCDEDLICIKQLHSSSSTTQTLKPDWTKTTPPPSPLFVDPRDF